ncbi:MAG TPA: lysophospholipid acyltransferase family protein [Actinomycetes bacterium]|nr:lysophospholipid acyltransferase family protein [Actinomycetes bacterium]
MRDLVYPPVIAAASGAFKALGLRLNVDGGEHVPTVGGAVIASNHISHLDFIFAGLGARSSRRYVRFMAKDSIFKHRIAGPLMRGMHHIEVDRDAGMRSFRDAMAALRAGEVVGIFPEATISRSFEPKEFKSGAERLAGSTKVPLIPMALWGTQRLWTYDDRSSMKQRNVPISVYVGEPIDSSGQKDAVAAELQRSVGALLERARSDYPDDGTGQWWQPQRLGGTAPPPADDDD